MELELWERFHVFKKVRNISRLDWDRQSRMHYYHLSLHALGKVKTNRPRASQICIGVIIVLSIKTQSLCDILIGRELNEITPTANGRLDILWQTLAAIFWSLVAEAKFGLPLSSSGVFKEFEPRQQKKKNWRKLESPAGKERVQNPKADVKLRLIQRFRELWVSIRLSMKQHIIDMCYHFFYIFEQIKDYRLILSSPLNIPVTPPIRFFWQTMKTQMKYQTVNLLFFSMFMSLKSQTSAIKFVFSFIPNQSNSEVSNVTNMSDVVYNTY